MKSAEIRKKFFDYFVRHHHERVASSPLIPAQDPTLLFANAGMNQFKDLFLGLEHRAYKRAVTIQKCVRAGGKHNDLDNVGFTKRHLTFFEMMGNFSFGDYFKKEAIHFAWEFITKDLKIPTTHLHVSVYKDDQESYDLWHNTIGLPAERIHRLGAADNFWQMGDTGPCGPCTEMYIDRGRSLGCGTQECAPGCSCDRFLEFWNLVFMQFERQQDGTDKPLKATGVDTGMGFERLCAILQDKSSVYETDVFAPIIKKIEELVGKNYQEQDPLCKAAFNVLADHIRSSTLLIADGCAPSNEGRGYVLRKIIRRAALFANKLEGNANLFPELSKVVVQDLGDIYPELVVNQVLIFKTLASEINKFSLNLIRGKNIIEGYFAQHTADDATRVITGEQAFKLYDTFGFPTELITIIAQENGFSVDMVGFEKEMTRQREQSGAKSAHESTLPIDDTLSTEFTGYESLQTPSTITGLIHENNFVDAVPAGQCCWVIAQKSPFFIVGGGQVPDKGWLTLAGKQVPLEGVQFIGNAIGAQVVAPVDLAIGVPVISTVNEELRINAMKNHTATHMLQAALIQLFGNQIKQSGSLVHPDYLRFDFTYHENLSAEDIKRVEDLVNQKIREDIELYVAFGTMKEAVKRGALAFFGDKYNPDKVRIVDIPGFSIELCGGTHVPRTGIIGTFKIIDVVSLSAGHRRIFAVTGPRAIDLFQETFNDIKTLSQQFAVKREDVLASVLKQKEQLKEAQVQLKQLKKQLMHTEIGTWEKNIVELNLSTRILACPEPVEGSKDPQPVFLYQELEGYTHEELKESALILSQKHPGFYFLVSKADGRTMFLALIHPSLQASIDMGRCAAWLKDTFGMRCGGSNLMLQGSVDEVPARLKDELKNWLAKQ